MLFSLSEFENSISILIEVSGFKYNAKKRGFFLQEIGSWIRMYQPKHFTDKNAYSILLPNAFDSIMQQGYNTLS